MLEIIMLLYQSEQFEDHAISSIACNTDIDYRLIIHDNNKFNEPLTSIWNDFARQSTSEYLCFVNPDIICAKNWASRLVNALMLTDVVIAAPSTPTAAGSYIQCIPPADIDELDKLASLLPANIIDDHDCIGFCYAVRSDWLKHVGYFDESFSFYGQETDLNFRAVDSQKRAVCVRNSVVYHYGRGSTKRTLTSDLQKEYDNVFVKLREKHSKCINEIGSGKTY